ncbi:hypothetical protein [Tardiphaga sp.]|jgi:hypothetical protein|uniref:hypothetical protein n=1 Tax=Tardiphaga sp. TaxID=1926292 RepID=UPI0037DA69C8
MFTLIALAVVTIGGRFLTKLYERHLDAQVGPWIVHELQPQRIQAQRRIDCR